MVRPTTSPHDGSISNPSSFDEAWRRLSVSGTQELETNAGTPFAAKAHVTNQGNHKGENCILIKGEGPMVSYSIYIYDCCWGHKTNCSKTYIDAYTPLL